VQPAPQAQPAQPSATGQWVYTQQYGWIWMPYGNQYVYTPENAVGTAYPSAYVYYPAYGWTWLTAPWVWGWGPRVHFSVGPRYYGWWGHPHFIGGFHGRFRGPVIHGGFRGPVIRGGFRGPAIHGGFRGHIGGAHFGGHISGGHVGGGHFGHGHH
jgi:hypothetical protein